MEITDILVIDDDVAIRNLFVALLQFHPYSFKVIESGEEALALFKTSKFRVCVVDINLNSDKLNGVELSILVKKGNHAEKVFALTGYPQIFTNFDSNIAGIDLVFRKSDGFKPLIKAIDDYLKG